MMKRRAFFLSTLAVTAACGFEPVYNPRGADQIPLRRRIILPTARNAQSFALRSQLARQFGEAGDDPLFRLDVDYSATSTELVITDLDVLERERLVGTGAYTVTRLTDDKVVLEGSINRTASYSSDKARFPGDVAETTTRERLARAVADDIALIIAGSVSDMTH